MEFLVGDSVIYGIFVYVCGRNYCVWVKNIESVLTVTLGVICYLRVVTVDLICFLPSFKISITFASTDN